MYNKIFITILLTLSFGNVQLSLGEYNHSTNSIPINYYSDSEIYGFQFISNQNPDVLLLLSASGGAAEDAGFTVTLSADTGVVLGFSFTNTPLPSGSHTLTNLNFEVVDSSATTEICLSDVTVSGSPGTNLSVNQGSCGTYSPPPVELSFDEYNGSNNTINLYASSPYDIYGYQFDMESASLTLADVSGGAVSEAGFTISTANNTSIGFSLTAGYIPAGENILLATLAFDIDAFEESEICLSGITLSDAVGSSLYITGPNCATYVPTPIELYLGENLVNGMVQVNLNSPYLLAGFQFDVYSSSVTLAAASGGASEVANFTVSTGPSTVLGFSFNGDTIESGSYMLTELSFEGSGTDTICIGDIVLSAADGAILPVDNLGCQEFNFNILEVEIIAPSDGDILSSLIGESIDVSVLGTGLSDGDHFHAYLDGEMMGMFYENSFSVEPTSSGYQTLEVRVANSSHDEYESEDALDSVEIGFVFKGDFNLDSIVNVLDLVGTVNHVLYSTDIELLPFAGANFNGDDIINVLDLVATVNYVLSN